MALERGDHAVVPASGALRSAGVSPFQRGVTSPEEERRRAQEGRGHLQATERVGGVPGQAELSDPAVHFLRGDAKSRAVTQVMWSCAVSGVSLLPLAPSASAP